MHRVIENQEACYYGLLGTPDALWLLSFETAMFGTDQWFHALPKVQQPALCYFGWRPLVQKPRESRKTDLFPNHTQQATQGLPFFAFDQPQQYDHKVLPLALTEAGMKDLYKLTQWLTKTYNWLGHGFSSGFRFHKPIIPV
jgi:hypothetical protein